ncbi:MAG: Glu/Leu/Phe/Val dehydrogenase dimerization domain-containing protein, partial [Nitrospirota bacterium]
MIDRYINGLAITVPLSGGAVGYIVVDSLINGTSSGGVRIAEDLPFPEVKALAREMTFKYSFIGLCRGGAKSGIRVPECLGPEEKKKVLEEFGRRVAPFIRSGIYYPGMDMNCGPDDLKALYRGAGITLKKTTDTSYFTALSVINAILACEAIKREGRPLTVAIEGFGSVGSYLAERLPEERFNIIALSTVQGAVLQQEGFAIAGLLSLRREYGDALIRHIPGSTRIGREELLELEVDILVPSARTWAINDRNAGNVRARFI